MTVKEITTEEEFKRVINSGKVILVDFYTTWCGPCKQISPVFQDHAKNNAHQENLEFYKVDIDKLEGVAAALKIRSIPTFHAFKDGKPIGDALSGANQPKLLALVEKSVEKSLEA